MSEEIFDIVDQFDVVVGQAPRAEVHRLGLKHRAVHVLVFNTAGELFLQRRSMTKDCHPGVWDSSASGHLAVGESYDAAALRELEEELGWCPLETPQPLFKLQAGEATGYEFVWVYRCRGEGPFRLHPEEIEEGRWVELKALSRWLQESPGDFAGAFPVIWRGLWERTPSPS